MSTTPIPTQSYHLPDVIGIISTFSLRTNHHCRIASHAAERRVLHSALLNTREAEWIGSMKVGLLMALCFPTCDIPQLTLLCEAGLWTVIAGMRTVEGSIRMEQGRVWQNLEESLAALEGIDIMKSHKLLQHLCHDPQLQRLALKASTCWKDRFKRALLSYYTFQRRVLLSSDTVPSLEDCIATRRGMYGNNVLFELAELLEVFSFPDYLQDVQREKLEKMKKNAFDIIAWSIDVASYHNAPTSYGYNLISALITHRNLSIQGAMNLAGNMIKEAFTSFCELETDLLESMRPKPSLVSALFSFFDRNWSGQTTTPEEGYDESETNERKLEKVKRYIQALKDCIVGSTHWLYETELFFGKKGAEVRTFGWVFANMGYAGLGPMAGPGERSFEIQE